LRHENRNLVNAITTATESASEGRQICRQDNLASDWGMEPTMYLLE
jgi:hypothetical protein